jgi:hypothetical protein
MTASHRVLVQHKLPLDTREKPFEVFYGYTPRHLGVTNLQSSTATDLAGWLQQRQEIAVLLHQHLLRAQQHMKHQEDKHRSEREFRVGDMVYMKLQPYAQTSVARQWNHKLSFKFFRPYEVLEHIGKVSYRLKLPQGRKIHWYCMSPSSSNLSSGSGDHFKLVL